MPPRVSPRHLAHLAVLAVLAAAFAPAAAASKVAPSADTSLLRTLLLASGGSSRARPADGTTGLMDGIFARAADAATPADAREAAPRAPRGIPAASARRRLMGGREYEDVDAQSSPAPPDAEADADAEADDAADDDATRRPPPPSADDLAAQPAQPPPPSDNLAARGFLANALLLNRLAAAVAGEEGAARGLVASAALASALRQYDPAAGAFAGVIEDIRNRREAAMTPPPPPTSGTGIPGTGDASPPGSPGSPPPPASSPFFDAARDAAVARAGEVFLDAAKARVLATLRDANVTLASGLEANITDLVDRLSLDAIDLDAEGAEEAVAAAVAAGLAAAEGAVARDADAADANRTSAVAAYETLFESALGAAGDFVASLFASANAGAPAAAPNATGADDSVTAGDVAALVAAAVDAARENAESFARLGLSAPGDEDGGDGGANATAAVELLDRVQATLAASRVDFAAALEASRAREKNAASDATTVLGPDEFIALIRGATGLPFGGDGAAPGPDAPFDYARLLASLDARDDTASLERVVEIFERDPLGILNLGGGGGGGGGPEDLPGDGGGAPGVAVLSGPPASETRDGSDDVVRLDPPEEVEGTVAPSARAEKPNEKTPFFERVETRVAFPVAAVVLASVAVLARYSTLGGSGGSSGYLARSSSRSRRGAGAPGDAAAEDPAEGSSTGADARAGAGAELSSGGGVVRRTSTSTKIHLGGGGGGQHRGAAAEDPVASHPIGGASAAGAIRATLGRLAGASKKSAENAVAEARRG